MIFLLHECQEKLGYKFKNDDLLRQCFTHSSYANEHNNAKNNEILEFFGDSILGFIVAEQLIKSNTAKNEGQLTTLKSQLVSKEPLSNAVDKMGVDKYILYGEGERKNSNFKNQSTKENLFEALVAGIYLDGGLEEAKKFVYKNLISSIKLSPTAKQIMAKDFKTRLQEYVQKNHLGKIEYKEKERTGPSHDPIFTMELYIDDKKFSEATGGSKAIATKKCAEIAFNNLNVDKNGCQKQEKNYCCQKNKDKQKQENIVKYAENKKLKCKKKETDNNFS